jgi:hypothetical protein
LAIVREETEEESWEEDDHVEGVDNERLGLVQGYCQGEDFVQEFPQHLGGLFRETKALDMDVEVGDLVHEVFLLSSR